MTTIMQPLKAGAKDLVRIGADKRTTSCSPSLTVGSLIENIGPTACLKEEQESEMEAGRGKGKGRRLRESIGY